MEDYQLITFILITTKYDETKGITTAELKDKLKPHYRFYCLLQFER